MVLVMSGTNPESKNTIQRRRVPAVIRQITPVNKNFAGLQVLPDETISD